MQSKRLSGVFSNATVSTKVSRYEPYFSEEMRVVKALTLRWEDPTAVWRGSPFGVEEERKFT